MDDVMSQEELGDALSEMAQTMWHGPGMDSYDPDHDGAAWALVDQAETLYGGVGVDLEELDDSDPEWDEDEGDVWNGSRFDAGQEWGLIADGYGELGMFDTDDLAVGMLEQLEDGELGSWDEF